MATITSYNIIKKMIDNDGVYPGDPQVEAIWEYENCGQIMWSISLCAADVGALLSSAYVQRPVLLWSKRDGLIQEPRRVHDDT